ncbi:hypothetical protein [Oleidesulfovibrio sp.]|uniref:hypothetical protein n=1 Tax=Oleidesulfovibrio sp. TaxID=2909707 RepID=UPI003A8790B4
MGWKEAGKVIFEGLERGCKASWERRWKEGLEEFFERPPAEEYYYSILTLCDFAIERKCSHYELAYYIAGHIYLDSKFSGYNAKKAYEKFTTAVEHGFVGAMFCKSMLEYEGTGCIADYAAARAGLSMLARIGTPRCRYVVGMILLNENKKIADLEEAYHWFLISNLEGEDAYSFLLKLEEDLSYEQVLEQQAIAKKTCSAMSARNDISKTIPWADTDFWGITHLKKYLSEFSS